MKARVFYFILSCFSAVLVQAQPVTASVDRDSILIGEKIHLVLKAFYAPDQKPEWFQLDSIPHFEIMERQNIDTQKYNNDIILTQTLILTSWDSGSWNIPPLRLPHGSTNPIRIEVGHTPFDVSQPYNDIHDIADVKTTRASNWYWYFLAAILLIAIGMLIFPPNKEKKSPAELDPGAYAKAMKRLDKIRRSDILHRDTKAYYSELVDVFRWYVQARKGIYSFSRTTTDLAVQLQQLNMPQQQYTELVQTLKQTDLVKFARHLPPQREAEQAFETIRESIVTIEKGNAV